MAQREVKFKSSVNIKSTGNPLKLAVNLEKDGDTAVLCTIVGIAQNVNRRADPKGGPDMVGLIGAFTNIPTDDKAAEVRSRICYLPDSVHDPIAMMLEKAHESDPTAVVRFAMEAAVCKGGTAGFTWEFKPLFDNAGGQAFDPLAGMVAALATPGGMKTLPVATAAETKAMAAVKQETGRFDKATVVKGEARTATPAKVA